MTEVPNKKFKYKKDRLDKIMVAIILFTLFCFGLIFYGMNYFNSKDAPREGANANEIDQMIRNRDVLERQIQQELAQ